jgi:nucleoside-diphosphate-sugar epimerase
VSSKRYTENTDIDFPLSPYAWSKLYCENILKYEHPNHMIIRLGFVISEHSIKYYKPILSINLLFIKVAFGIPTLVKAVSSKSLIKMLFHDLANYQPGKRVEYWDKKIKIIEINKMLYPKHIWIRVPSSLLKKLIKVLYCKTPFVKFIDYASFGNK